MEQIKRNEQGQERNWKGMNPTERNLEENSFAPEKQHVSDKTEKEQKVEKNKDLADHDLAERGPNRVGLD